MPALITSREFIDSLFVTCDSNEEEKDLSSFIQHDFFGYKLICDFQNIDEYEIALKDNPIWELLMDKYDNIEFNPSIKVDVMHDEFYKNLDEQNIILLPLEENVCENLTLERGFIYVPLLNIEKHWKKIRIARNNVKFKVTNDQIIPEPVRLNCWSKLLEFVSPITSIIIFDRYILLDESNGKLKDNLFKLLKMLCSNKKLKRPLDLMIISEFNNDDDLIKAYEKVNSFLHSSNLKHVNLNIVKHHKSNYPKDFEGLHYRTVFTNYFKFKCDDSFNFFKSNGKVNNDADLSITFNLDSKERPFFEKEIKDLKKYISKLKNIDPKVKLANKIYFHKHKNNYLLN